MRRIGSFIGAALLMLALAVPAAAEYSPRENYMARMLEACCAGDYAAGSAAAAKRAEKIEAMGLSYPQVDFEELWLLAKIIYAEAGSVWLPTDWKMSVGEVVLNRVASPEFPDTVREVLEQPGQYYGKDNRYFDGLLPSMDCARAALRLLEGERVLGDASVVFQANFPQGGGVFRELQDQWLGSTYLCYSMRPELYGA